MAKRKYIYKADIPTRMRDGRTLPAELYLPAEGNGTFPTVVERTAHYKERAFTPPIFEHLAERGYAVLAQNSAGNWKEEGEIRPFFSADTTDVEDGYDTIEWAAAQPWSNGKVGGFGYSYPSWCLWKLAPTRPPHLVTMFYGGRAPRSTDWQLGGVFRIGRNLLWTVGPMATLTQGKVAEPMKGESGAASRTDDIVEVPHGPVTYKAYWHQKEHIDREKWLWYLPLKDLPCEFIGGMRERLNDWLDHIHEDRWHLLDKLEQVTIPIFHRTSWYDRVSRTVELFAGMQSRAGTEEARKNQRMIIGPWSHSLSSVLPRKIGEVDFGPEAELDHDELMLRWFDYWLKGEQNGIMESAPVRIFVMGTNRWRDEDQWPPAQARATDYYLHSGGRANTPYGDGVLNLQKPTQEEADTYVYDPKDPVMTLYGYGCHDEPHDQRVLEHRRDVLVYQTEPLKEPVEVIGVPVLTLYAASSAPDTDFVIKLIDVWPDGFSQNLCYGIVRARYREGFNTPRLMDPGTAYEFKIELLPTGNLFQKGHRIRVDVTSSDFPNFDRNHNTGGDDYGETTLVAAKQTVLHNSTYSSRITLPVMF
jgi:putative CocE/NonD family hydrolase